MPIIINNESYDGLGSLHANAGDFKPGQLKFSSRFSVGSGTSNTFTYGDLAGNFTITIQSGNFGDFGIVAGSNIQVDADFFQAGPPIPVSQNRVVTYVNGNVIHLDAPLVDGGGSNLANGTVFPGDIASGMLITVTDNPDAIEFEFNLTQNGGSSLNSVIDNELIRLSSSAISTMNIGNVIGLVQQGNKSGGFIKDVTLTLDSIIDGFRNYTIDFRFWDWGVISPGVVDPDYYEQDEHLAPISNIKLFAEFGNPNGVLQKSTENTEADTGGFRENGNGGNNQFSVSALSFRNANNDVINGIDFGGVTKFEAIVDAPGQNAASTFNIGMIWRPIDSSVYQNKPSSILNNLVGVVPDIDIVSSVLPDPTVRQGFADDSGARVDFSDLRFRVIGTQVFITGTITPNGAYTALFSTIPDGGRRITLWVSLGFGSGVFENRVSLPLYDEDNIDAPVIGIQLTNIVTAKFFDHGLRDISQQQLPNMTTEDDVNYVTQFLLTENAIHDGVRGRLFMRNNISQEEFDLEEIFIDLSTVPQVGGKYIPSTDFSRGFGLPPTSDRNNISLERDDSIDTGNEYGLKFEYGFLADWRTWAALDGVADDFFDPALQNDGKYKNWLRYSQNPNWTLLFGFYLRTDGIDDFNLRQIRLRPLEDENVTTVVTYKIVDTAIFPLGLIGGEIIEVTAVLTWNTLDPFTNPWSEVTIENFENGDRFILSTEEPQGDVAENPLKPISTSDRLDLNFAANVATLKFLVDTTIINVNDVSLGYRIFSDPGVITGKKHTDGTQKLHTDGAAKQKI